MRHLCLILGLVLAAHASLAAESAKPPVNAPARAEPAPSVKAVTAPGPGQAGYVHYFLITHPDGELEYQVGIELEEQRVAWSFPEVGVTVSPFVKKGTVQANGKTFNVEHLHGIRPFAESAMRAFQKDLPRRVAYWVDNQTPYCLLRQPGEPFCLSCGDFVVRILWPGAHPMIPALPQDFLRMSGAAYTTDDLLLYLAGLYGLPDRRSMRAKLAALDIPTAMREDLAYMIGPVDGATPPANVAAAPKPPAAVAANKPAAKAAPGAQPAPAKSAGRLATRRAQDKKG